MGSAYRASLVAQMVKNLLAIQETWIRSLDQEDPLEKGMQPTPVFLPGELHGQRSLMGHSPWGCKELDMTERPDTSLHFIRWRKCSPQINQNNDENKSGI